MTRKTYEDIVEELRAQALDERDTGWLSDMCGFDLEYDERDSIIDVDRGHGSIDLGHLAGIVLSLLED